MHSSRHVLQMPRFFCTVYTDSTGQLFGSLLQTHTLLVQTHTHMKFPPPRCDTSKGKGLIILLVQLMADKRRHELNYNITKVFESIFIICIYMIHLCCI